MKILRFIFSIIIAITISSSVIASEEEDKASAFYEEAYKYEENGDTTKAENIYMKIIKEYPDVHRYPNSTYAEDARRRLIWLSGDRSWIVENVEEVIPLFKKAILNNELELIRKYASKVNFSAMVCESEGDNTTFDEFKEDLQNRYPKNKKLSITNRSKNRKGLITSGWEGLHPYIIINFENIENGWEWIGITYCGMIDQNE